MLRKFIWTIFFTTLIWGYSTDAFSETMPSFPSVNTLKASPQTQQVKHEINISNPSDSKKTSTSFVRRSQKGQVSLNFDEADIHAVMQTVLGNLLKVNYIIDPAVKGTITFRSVKPVPYEEILPIIEVILQTNGIAIVENGGIYRVVPINDVSKQSGSVNFGRNPDDVDMTGKAVIQVVQIKYGSSSEIARVLTPFISNNAVSVDVPKNNQLVLVDTPANIRRLLNLINIFDSEDVKKKNPQVFVYNVQNSKAKDIVLLLNQIFGARLSGDAFVQRMMDEQTQQQQQGQQQDQPPPVIQPTVNRGTSTLISQFAKIFYDELTNTIIIMGTPDDYKVISDTIKTVDVIPRQVIIEGVVAQITLSDSMNMGFSWAINTSLDTLGLKLGMNTSNLDFTNSETVTKFGKGFSLIGTDNSSVVRAVIQALEADSKAKLLASPHILVSDNREARIQVGQSVPIPTSETIASAGTPAQKTIQYKDIGIILKVKPRINDSGLVAMDITQEISNYEKITLYSNEQQILLNKTEASTNMVVQDGQTIIIGGLIREEKSKTSSGFPFLSKIPILGFLFGETEDSKKRTEIVILLTPHVIKNQQRANAITSQYIDKFTGTGASQGIKKEELVPGINTPGTSPDTLIDK